MEKLLPYQENQHHGYISHKGNKATWSSLVNGRLQMTFLKIMLPYKTTKVT